MIESIFIIGKVIGTLFLVWKFASLIRQGSDMGEVGKLMGKSLSMRAGIFSK